RVVVAGERSWQYAHAMGVPEAKIVRGVYGYDSAFDRIGMRRTNWPRRFVFTARYSHEKAVDVLLAAYQKYRAEASDPWPLTCCGTGPLQSLIDAADGVDNRGFVPPNDLCDLL